MIVRHRDRKPLVYVVAVFAAALLATAVPAGANVISYGSYGVLNSQTVHITGPASFDETVGSGQIELFGSPNAFAWCIDIFDFLASSGTYTVYSPPTYTPGNHGEPVPPGPPSQALSITQIGQIGALADYGNAHVGDVGGFDISSGTQIAIWRIEYPTYTFNGTPGANTEALALLALLPSLTPDTNWSMLAEINNQGLVVNQGLQFTPPPHENAPEPGTLMLLGLGLAGLAASRRRKQ